MPVHIGVPDPNASFGRVGPTEKEWTIGSDSFSGWVSVPAPEDPSRWVYLWFDGPVRSARYRCYRESERPSAWSLLENAKEVFAATGYREDDEESDDEGAALGAAAVLLPGTYRLDFLVSQNGCDVLLDGIRFEISKREGSSASHVEESSSAARKPWWKLW